MVTGGGEATAAGALGLPGAGGSQAAWKAETDYGLQGSSQEGDEQNHEEEKESPQTERGKFY